MRTTAFAAGLTLAASLAVTVSAKPLNSVGVTVGSLGNPYFVAVVKGVTDEAHAINPSAKITSVSSDYDLNKQSTQIENFISAGVDLIILNAADSQAIAPAVRKAEAAGIPVIAVDVAAQGADATVMTDNVAAGAEACSFIAEKLSGKGDVVIVNGPHVSSVIDRVHGCEAELKKSPGIKVLSDNEDAKGSRDGGFTVMQGLLTRLPHIDAVYAINDPTAIGCSLAARQLHRDELFIASTDGAPDIEAALKDKQTRIFASSSQDPYGMARKAVQVGVQVMDGKPPADKTELLKPVLVTTDNVNDYKGWTTH